MHAQIAHPIEEANVADAAEVLLRSFAADPALLFILPDGDERTRLCPQLARTMVRFALRCGSPIGIGDGKEGIALWFAPEDAHPEPDDFAALGMYDVPGLIGPEAWRRMQILLNHVDALHHVHAPDPHWYLAMIGVQPELQGRGIGSALIRPVLNRADSSGVACYLETPNAHNVPFYQRSGFEICAETDIPLSDVHLWIMRREPRQA